MVEVFMVGKIMFPDFPFTLTLTNFAIYTFLKTVLTLGKSFPEVKHNSGSIEPNRFSVTKWGERVKMVI